MSHPGEHICDNELQVKASNQSDVCFRRKTHTGIKRTHPEPSCYEMQTTTPAADDQNIKHPVKSDVQINK